MRTSNDLCQALGIKLPIFCGAMYPCSNPELVAAVSAAGGMGIIQPLSLLYVHGQEFKGEFKRGLEKIQQLTKAPVGMNVIVETSSEIYTKRMQQWVNDALESGVRFFVTALGNPSWVVDVVHKAGGIVFHDVTSRKWAEKAVAYGVDGLICVNHSAGGHAGEESAQKLFDQLSDLGLPLICAGGIATPQQFSAALKMGYIGVQMGTRFIASRECKAHEDYKQAICQATQNDIVLTEKITGVPVSVIRTPYVEKIGTRAGWFAKKLLQNSRTKHGMRLIYTLSSVWRLKKASLAGGGYKDYWQAGKSAGDISQVESVATLLESFSEEYNHQKLTTQK